VIALIKGVHDRTAQRGEAIENPMQLFGRKRIGEGLRPLPVVDAQKGVVGKGKADAGGGKPPRQPAVSVAIELQPEGTPGRHAQITQADLVIDEIKGVAQALAAVGLEESLPLVLSCQGL
jgi:hypothetical protein